MRRNNGFTILWDFDGTLFDTYPAYVSIFKNVLNNEQIDKEEIFKHVKISFSHAIQFYQFSEEQLQQFIQLGKCISLEELKPFAHVEKILAYADQNVIMTHKSRKATEKLLAHYGWESYFKEIVAGDDGFPCKPNKESYEYLHHKYQIDLAIGDREIDILPAKELGISTCLFQNNICKEADFYLNDYREFWDEIAPAFGIRG